MVESLWWSLGSLFVTEVVVVVLGSLYCRWGLHNGVEGLYVVVGGL